MSQDLLSQIKEAEEKAEKEITELEESLKLERENKLLSLEEKISSLKKEHKERLLNLDTELENEFKKVDENFALDKNKEKETLKKRAKNNFDSFFVDLI